MNLLLTSGRRHLARHRGQTVLAIAGVALGVAVVVGIDLANGSIARAFSASTQLVAGRSTHQLIGIGDTLDERLLVMLRKTPGVRAAAPVVETTLRLAVAPDRSLTLLGLDPFSDAPFRGYLGAITGASIDIRRLVAEPGAIVVTGSLAASIGLNTSGTLQALAGSRSLALQIVGIIDLGATTTDEILFADIATAQEIASIPGRLSRVDLILDDGAAETLQKSLPADVMLTAAGARNQAVVGMTEAFRINLAALSLLALLVGMFLVYSTMAFMVVRQRRAHGMFRAIGVTDVALFRATLAEALVIGIPGTLLGLALGQWLGIALLDLVLRTVDDLYFRVVARPAAIDALSLAKGLLLGIGGTLVAAWVPAREAARTLPHSLLQRASAERHATSQLPRQFFGAVALASICVVALTAGDTLVTAFVGLFAFVGAAALLAPGATALFARALEHMVRPLAGAATMLALRGISASLSRTGVAVAALTVAVAAVIGVGTMIGSFRHSVADWLARTVTADLYISALPGGREPLDEAMVDRIAAIDGVAATRRIRRVRLPTADGELRVWAVRLETLQGGLELVAGDADKAWTAFNTAQAIFVSEPLAQKRALAVGDTLSLPASQGPQRFRIAAVFRDYTSDQGVVVMHLDTYRRHWTDHALTGIGVFVADSADIEATRRAVETVVGRQGNVTPSAEIRALSLAIFDRTFAVTEVLRLLAGLVAFLGVFSALQALQLERARELAVLRAIGFLPRQVGVAIVGQTAALGLAAGLFAIPIGIGLAWLLVNVINRRAFGWSMAFELSPSTLAQGVGLAVLAALLAGAYPALRSLRAPPAAALRDE